MRSHPPPDERNPRPGGRPGAGAEKNDRAGPLIAPEYSPIEGRRLAPARRHRTRDARWEDLRSALVRDGNVPHAAWEHIPRAAERYGSVREALEREEFAVFSNRETGRTVTVVRFLPSGRVLAMYEVGTEGHHRSKRYRSVRAFVATLDADAYLFALIEELREFDARTKTERRNTRRAC